MVENKEELTKDSRQLLPIDFNSESALYPGNVNCEFLSKESARSVSKIDFKTYYKADGSRETVFIEVYSLNNNKLLDISILKQNGGLKIRSTDVSYTNHNETRLVEFFVSNSSSKSLSEYQGLYSEYNNATNTNTVISLMGETIVPIQIPVMIFGCWYTLHMKPNIR